MALYDSTLEMFIETIDAVLSQRDSCKIFEFGDQVLLKDPSVTAKKHITNLYGNKISEYVSLDLHGKNETEVGDMREDLSRFIYGSFDIVTNMGTSEHVQVLDKQYECFKNVHDLCKLDGFIIHEIPFDKDIEAAWGGSFSSVVH